MATLIPFMVSPFNEQCFKSVLVSALPFSLLRDELRVASSFLTLAHLTETISLAASTLCSLPTLNSNFSGYPWLPYF